MFYKLNDKFYEEVPVEILPGKERINNKLNLANLECPIKYKQPK